MCSVSVLILEITLVCVVCVCLRVSLCTYVCVMCDCQWEHIELDGLLLALVQWCECVWPSSSSSLGPTQTADPPACCSFSLHLNAHTHTHTHTHTQTHRHTDTHTHTHTHTRTHTHTHGHAHAHTLKYIIFSTF